MHKKIKYFLLQFITVQLSSILLMIISYKHGNLNISKPSIYLKPLHPIELISGDIKSNNAEIIP